MTGTVTSTESTRDHRWSGWPGAWCLDCGQEDQREICLADGCSELDMETGECPTHVNPPCPEPGSRRCDPYARGQDV